MICKKLKKFWKINKIIHTNQMFNPGTIVDINTLDASKVTIGKLTANKSGKGSSAYISYDGNRFSVKMLDTRFPFGVSNYSGDEPGANEGGKWSLAMQPTDDQIKVFKALDEQILNSISRNLELRKVLGGDSIEDSDKPEMALKMLRGRYYSLLKYSKDKVTKKVNDAYPPTVRCGLGVKGDVFTTEFFSSKNGVSEPMHVDTIPDSEFNAGRLLRGDSNGSVLFIMSLWATEKSFGVKMHAVQVKTSQRSVHVSGSCLLDSMMPDTQAVNLTVDPTDLEEYEHVEHQSEPEEEVLEEILEEESEVEEVESPPKPQPKVVAKKTTVATRAKA